MNWNVWVIQHLLASLLFKAAFSFEFQVTVPRGHVVAAQGQQVVLPCSFTVSGSLGSLVVTWQRGQEVVHSFYHGRGQLDRQSRRYANRTSLMHSDVERGDSSLRLERSNMEDEGDYTCSVSTLLGSQRKTLSLKVAALYAEPHSNLKVSPSGLELLLTSHGGRPAPCVQWLDDRGEDITNHTSTLVRQDTEGLFTVSSNLTLQTASSRSLTFILQNRILGQVIRRDFTLDTGIGAKSSRNHDRDRWGVALYLVIFLVIIIFLQATALILQRRNLDQRKPTALRTEHV
ncbi:butyrophilin subfamily 1 member A1 isoform X1 [Osmerus eperlanus]|uniref:butyrophilin subfamily 1 member A1 isoform X1 n=1 Tax=Osmerus eperlanus TaxID=29151 RepID=UPI002E14F598